MSSAATTTTPATTTTTGPVTNAAGKKICCACPETKKLRDECVIKFGEEGCKEFIEAHKACLRKEGFNV